jgi:hypothetical protein
VRYALITNLRIDKKASLKKVIFKGKDKISKKAYQPMDQKEKDLMESIERDEWQSVFSIPLVAYATPSRS